MFAKVARGAACGALPIFIPSKKNKMKPLLIRLHLEAAIEFQEKRAEDRGKEWRASLDCETQDGGGRERKGRRGGRISEMSVRQRVAPGSPHTVTIN